MAEGCARASRRAGVVLATSGPGATNLVTPIANAKMDSTPLVCVTGQVHSALIGSDAFQECDIVSVVRPLVKYGCLVRDVGELADVLRLAFRRAREGRPGPVLVDVPRDVQGAEVDFIPVGREPEESVARSIIASEDSVVSVARAIEAARRPILYVGGGAINAGASVELIGLAERARIPVVTTLMAKGVLPERHELCFGCPDMHGGKWSKCHA